MLQLRPFAEAAELFDASERIWNDLATEDWLEAFSHHPQIGGRDSLKAKFASTQQWSQTEQSGVRDASEEVLDSLACSNAAYTEKFGYIFIVCATGKSAEEMLSMLQERLKNDQDVEIQIAMREQSKITRIRLEKLLS